MMKMGTDCKTNRLLLGIALGLTGAARSLPADDLTHRTVTSEDAAYGRFELGAAFQRDLTLRYGDGMEARSTFDPGFRFDAVLGRHFLESWSGELELGLLYNSMKTGAGAPLTT